MAERRDPYTAGWQDCAETIAGLLEIKARSLPRRTLRDRIIKPTLAAVYRHAAEVARATTEVSRD